LCNAKSGRKNVAPLSKRRRLVCNHRLKLVFNDAVDTINVLALPRLAATSRMFSCLKGIALAALASIRQIPVSLPAGEHQSFLGAYPRG